VKKERKEQRKKEGSKMDKNSGEIIYMYIHFK
jgi:hypothetical protein